MGLRPILNYISLKRCRGGATAKAGFETHTKLHLSHTEGSLHLWKLQFETHTKLHLSQTRTRLDTPTAQFETHTKLHLSQTEHASYRITNKFETHTKLHLSQTEIHAPKNSKCLRPILNYISLKQIQCHHYMAVSLRPILNYISLKLYGVRLLRWCKFETHTKLHLSQTR